MPSAKIRNNMKKYRILIETEASGKKWYYPLKRYWFFFWDYLAKDSYSVGYNSLSEAMERINEDIEDENQRAQKIIIKREYMEVTCKEDNSD